MLISRTPYRFSLYGGGLDYPEWYKSKSTRILCASLNYFCYQTVRILPPFFSHRYRVAYSRVENVDQIDQIEHPAAREAIRKYGGEKSLEITHVGDLPSRSGIGSSSAFTVGLINSLSALNGKFMGRTALAEAAIKLEQDILKERVGIQDQCAAAFGGLTLIEANEGSINPRKFVSREEYVDYVTDNLLMGFDGIERFSAIASNKISKSLSKKDNSELLDELAEVFDYGINAFGEEADINRHAELTREARNIKMQLNGDVSNQRTKELIEATENAGSLCTRVMGAGGGGFFVCWAPKHKQQRIKESVKVNTWVDVIFSNTGSQVIFSS